MLKEGRVKKKGYFFNLLIFNGEITLELMITEGDKQKRQSLNDPAFFFPNSILIYFLKNFFLPYPASPSNPEPRRSKVAGSGTAV